MNFKEFCHNPVITTGFGLGRPSSGDQELSEGHGLRLALYAVQASKDFSHLKFKGNFISIK